MIGIPSVYNTKQDYYNAVDYACSKNEGKSYVAKALHDLKDNVLRLTVEASNASAINLYKKYGFRNTHNMILVSLKG